MNSFVYSYYISVFVQCLAFFIQFYGVFLRVTPELVPLKYALNAINILEHNILWLD